jgi:hypothetical protein
VWQCRRVWIRRLLSPENSFEWVVRANDEFNPKMEELDRFCYQACRVLRRGWRGFVTPRAAAAFRIQLESFEGRMLYVLRGPNYAAAVLRRAMYDRVVLVDRSEFVAAGGGGPAPLAGGEGEDEGLVEVLEPALIPSVDELPDDGEVPMKEEYL